MEMEMTSRALSGQKDCDKISLGAFSWALAVRIDLALKPMAAAIAVVAVINALRSILF
jgi:hypothetical protein